VPDLPTILDRIRREPRHEAHWLALSDELRDNGQDDLALVVRGYCPLLGKVVADGKTPEEALRFFTSAGIRRLARRLRADQERGLDHRLD
jgi:hypothetical protein